LHEVTQRLGTGSAHCSLAVTGGASAPWAIAVTAALCCELGAGRLNKVAMALGARWRHERSNAVD